MNRVVQMRNSLPEEVVRAPSFSAFKARLDIKFTGPKSDMDILKGLRPNIFITYIVNCP